jgi:hypothetical protein
MHRLLGNRDSRSSIHVPRAFAYARVRTRARTMPECRQHSSPVEFCGANKLNAFHRRPPPLNARARALNAGPRGASSRAPVYRFNKDQQDQQELALEG